MTKVNPNNENETKSSTFPWDIFKFDDIYFLIKNIKVFNILSKLKFVSFTNKLNKSIRNEAKSDILLCDIFKSDVIYLLSKNIKVFQ